MDDSTGTDKYVSAREITIREMNSLRGRLCTVIESAGLPKSQERAIVLLIKNLSYQNQAVITELIDKLENEYHRMEEMAGMGSSGLQFQYNSNKLR